MVSKGLRQIVVVVFWLGITVVALVVTLWACQANYLGCKAALELSGYESQPLSTDSVVGTYLSAFFPDATLAQFLALFIVSVEALTIFMIFFFGFDTLRIVEIRRAQRALGDEEQVRMANQVLIRNGIVTAILTGMVVWIVRWDVDLFRYRSIAGAYGIEDAQVATATIQNWALEMKQNGQMFAWSLARVGAWGYVAATACSCVVFELSYMQLSEHFSAAMAPIDEAFERWYAPQEDAPEATLGYYEEQGDAAEHAEEGAPSREEAPVPVAPTAASGRANARANGHTNGHANGNGAAAATLFEAPAIPAGNGAAAAPALATRPEQEPERHPVIGGVDERVTLADAILHPKHYYVDVANRRIFSRAYWDALHQPEPTREPEEAER